MTWLKFTGLMVVVFALSTYAYRTGRQDDAMGYKAAMNNNWNAYTEKDAELKKAQADFGQRYRDQEVSFQNRMQRVQDTLVVVFSDHTDLIHKAFNQTTTQPSTQPVAVADSK